MIHDSDVLYYWLYDAGTEIDTYDSCPDYWGDESTDGESRGANIDAFLEYCQPTAKRSQLEEVLGRSSADDATAASGSAFVFAEDRLVQLGCLLGLCQETLMIDFNDIGREIAPDAIGAVWVGSAEQHTEDATADEAGDGVHVRMPHAPLHDAAAKDDVAAIARLVANGTDVNEIPHGYTVTALAMAACQGGPASIRKLIALGADLSKKHHEGATPLHFAVQSARAENVRTLGELGADVNEYDSRLGTLLHLALVNPSPDVVRVLIELGVDRDRKNPAGCTPLRALQMQLDGLRQMQRTLEGAAVAALSKYTRVLEEVEHVLADSSD
jgi:hypothetical protein